MGIIINPGTGPVVAQPVSEVTAPRSSADKINLDVILSFMSVLLRSWIVVAGLRLN